MKRFLLILILMAYHQASATVEDPGGGSNTAMNGILPSEPDVLSLYPPSPCPAPKECFKVSVDILGPTQNPNSKEAKDAKYVTQGRTIEFLVSVKNSGSSTLQADIGVSSKSCPLEWFSWTSESLQIPSGSTRSLKLAVCPSVDAEAGAYEFTADASGRCCKSESAKGLFVVQSLDYASETAISGTGMFQLDKNVRSLNSGMMSNKNVLFSGSVDALVKNEYMVDRSRGKNPNFEEQDAVDNYNAVNFGDALIGTESFKSSAIFGGVGAKVLESYDVQQMEFKSQSFDLHQTGSQKKTAEFKTADNFTGFYLIDAKQTIPGQKSLKEHEEYLGSFEINRKILFRNEPAIRTPCFEGDCMKEPTISSPSVASSVNSPCSSGSCDKFADNLNKFLKST